MKRIKVEYCSEQEFGDSGWVRVLYRSNDEWDEVMFERNALDTISMSEVVKLLLDLAWVHGAVDVEVLRRVPKGETNSNEAEDGQP